MVELVAVTLLTIPLWAAPLSAVRGTIVALDAVATVVAKIFSSFWSFCALWISA